MTESLDFQALVAEALAAISQLLPQGEELPAERDASLLSEHGGPLDSMGVVNLMVALEGVVEARLGRSLSLADALGEPADSSPFRSALALTEYLQELPEIREGAA